MVKEHGQEWKHICIELGKRAAVWKTVQLRALEVLRDMLERKLVADNHYISVMNQSVRAL